MATADELKIFLSKRGYDTEVTKSGGTFVISILSKSVEDVTNLLVGIGEPGRFVVAVKLADVVPTIGEILGVFKLKEDVANLDTTIKEDVINLETTLKDKEDSLKTQMKESIALLKESLNDKIETIGKTVKELDDDMSYIKKQSWWKRFLGVK